MPRNSRKSCKYEIIETQIISPENYEEKNKRWLWFQLWGPASNLQRLPQVQIVVQSQSTCTSPGISISEIVTDQSTYIQHKLRYLWYRHHRFPFVRYETYLIICFLIDIYWAQSQVSEVSRPPVPSWARRDILRFLLSAELLLPRLSTSLRLQVLKEKRCLRWMKWCSKWD